MTPPAMAPGTVLYRSTCPRCRWLSRLIVLGTAGRIRRAAIDSESARELYEACAECRGRPALWDGQELTAGARARRRGLRLVFGLAAVPAPGSRGSRWARGPR